MIIRPGIYQHYKGNKYQVLGVSRHSETLEELVVYRALHDKEEIWVRPLSMFFDKANKEGKEVDRFEFVSDQAVE